MKDFQNSDGLLFPMFDFQVNMREEHVRSFHDAKCQLSSQKRSLKRQMFTLRIIVPSQKEGVCLTLYFTGFFWISKPPV